MDAEPSDSLEELQKRFDEYCESLTPLTDAEQLEMILGYFAVLLNDMDDENLRALRRHILTLHPGTKEEATITEILDGHVALRDIRRSAE
jgi:hypothetical protein